MEKMSQHRVYSAIVHAVNSRRLKEPFGPNEFRDACPGLGVGTWWIWLSKVYWIQLIQSN